MSALAQNVLPVPPSTTTATSSSASARRKASIRPSLSGVLSALRLSGRFMVI